MRAGIFLFALACGDPQPVSEPDPPAAPVVAEPSPAPPAVDSCEALARAAASDLDDAALLPVLCPDVPLDPITARGVLLSAGSSEEARRVAPLLRGFPELQAMARLVAHVEVPLPVPPTLGDIASTPVTPLDDAVLAQVQLARALLHAPNTDVDTRTRARAWLAKTYMGAVKQIGVGPTRAPAPFQRLLAAHAIHYGRSFCASFWQRQVPGLFDLCAQTEVDVLAATLALEAGHHGGDPAIVTVELHEGRRYVTRDDVRTRIEKRTSESPEANAIDPDRLAPTVSELERLVAHGFVDLAIGHALHVGRAASGPGLAPMQQLLVDALARSEGDEYGEQVAARFAAVRKQVPRPPEDGPGEIDPPREPPWPTAAVEADRMLAEIASASGELARRRALGRAVLAARRRPDALLAAIDLAARSPDPKLAEALPLLRAVARELDDGNLRWLRRSQTADTDRARRQEAARAAREAGAIPR